MDKFKTIWLLILATLFIGTICWSIVTLTLKSANLIDSSAGLVVSMKGIAENTGTMYKQLSNWINAFLPEDLCTDISKYTREYYQQYGKDDLKYIFDSIKGEAAKRKLQPPLGLE